jgi:hypothetical protein
MGTDHPTCTCPDSLQGRNVNSAANDVAATNAPAYPLKNDLIRTIIPYDWIGAEFSRAARDTKHNVRDPVVNAPTFPLRNDLIGTNVPYDWIGAAQSAAKDDRRNTGDSAIDSNGVHQRETRPENDDPTDASNAFDWIGAARRANHAYRAFHGPILDALTSEILTAQEGASENSGRRPAHLPTETHRRVFYSLSWFSLAHQGRFNYSIIPGETVEPDHNGELTCI